MYLVNVEPTVEELLNDPIAHLLMTHDGLQPEYVWACVNDARLKLSGREAQEREAGVVTGR